MRCTRLQVRWSLAAKILFVVTSAVSSAASAQPSNDHCSNAIVISALPFESGEINWSTATTDTYANPNCDTTLNTAGAKYGVWFSFTPATTGIRNMAQTTITSDTVTSIWTGTCPNGLTQRACSNPESSQFTFTAGTRYLIMVSKWGATPASGVITFTMGDPATPPGNDTCAGATLLTLTGSLPAATDQGDNSNATDTNDGPIGACAFPSHAIWWKFTPDITGAYQIDLCGTIVNTLLSVFTTPDCATFAEIACNDDSTSQATECSPNPAASRVRSVVLTAGTTYFIRAGSRLATSGYGPITVNVALLAAGGACCHPSTGECVVSDSGPTGCPNGKTFMGGVCTPNPCTQPTGACCCGATCSTTAAASCTGTNTSFAGLGTVCNAPGDPINPCCLADYNRSGAVSVQDIFDFLAAYFGGDPCADINVSGGISVQDIFDYLAVYFGSCG